MPSEWKFFLHSWIFEVHSKNSDCILSAFQIFGPIRVAGPNVFIMLKPFEVQFEVENIERHSKCILTALWLHSKYSYGPLRHSNNIRNILIAFKGESEVTASHFKSCQNVPNAPRMSRNAPRMLSEFISILKEFIWNAVQMSSPRRNLSIAARMRLECSRNVPIGPRMSPDVIHHRIAYPGIYKEFPFRRHSGSFRL